MKIISVKGQTDKQRQLLCRCHVGVMRIICVKSHSPTLFISSHQNSTHRKANRAYIMPLSVIDFINNLLLLKKLDCKG